MILSFNEVYTINGKTEITDFRKKILKGDKIHTIREDKHNRWKAGNSIQCAHGVRTKFYDCFFETVCYQTQKIEITEDRRILVENKELSPAMVRLLAQNDGFKSEAHFWHWFGSYIPFEGKIIHWTKFEY